jgi:subtilisin
MSRGVLQKALGIGLAKLARARLAPVDVCILDSGIDATHPFLRKRVRESFAVSLARGKLRVAQERRPHNGDRLGHGTSVASIVAGVAPNARLIDVRVLDPQIKETGSAMLAGFEHALAQGYKVINISLAAGPELADPLRLLCERAYHQNQIVVAARRNMPVENEGFPAELPLCVSVDADLFPSALHLRFRPDQKIEYAALGDDVVVAAAGGGYTRRTGSSYAAPAVSGLAALLVGAYGDLRPFEIKALLKAFATS